MSPNHCLVRGWDKGGEAAAVSSLALPGTGGEQLSPGAADFSPQGLPAPSEISFTARWPEAGWVGRADVQVTSLVLLPSHAAPLAVFRASQLTTEAQLGPQNPLSVPWSWQVPVKGLSSSSPAGVGVRRLVCRMEGPLPLLPAVVGERFARARQRGDSTPTRRDFLRPGPPAVEAGDTHF